MSIPHLSLAILIAVLAGCGNNTPTDTQNSNAASPVDNPSSVEPSTEKGLEGKLEIQYFVGGYGDTWWKEVISEFEASHPNLEVIQHAGPQINQQMNNRWIAGNPPDVVYIDGDGTFTEKLLVQNEQLMDISEWLETATNAEGELIKDQLIGQPRSYDGVNYAIPLVFRGVWYMV